MGPLVIIALHLLAGESETCSFLLPLIVVAVIAGVLLIVAVILMIIVIILRADIKRSYYLFCIEYKCNVAFNGRLFN